jgi:hypothetical protein
MNWKFRLQLTAFLAAIVGSAGFGIWLAVHFDAPGFLVLCIPAFAVLLAGGP